MFECKIVGFCSFEDARDDIANFVDFLIKHHAYAVEELSFKLVVRI